MNVLSFKEIVYPKVTILSAFTYHRVLGRYFEKYILNFFCQWSTKGFTDWLQHSLEYLLLCFTEERNAGLEHHKSE